MRLAISEAINFPLTKVNDIEQVTIYDFLLFIDPKHGIKNFDTRTGGKPDGKPDVSKPRFVSLSHQQNTVHGLVNIYLLSCTYYICF